MSSPRARPLLLRLPNWLGDLVQAWPVLEAAARDPRRPALFVGPAAFEAFVHPRFPAVPYIPWSRERRFSSAGEIRRHHPESALLLTDSLSSAILTALAGVPERIGYAAELRGPLLTKRVPRQGPSRSSPRVREYAALAGAAGLRVEEGTPCLEARAGERDVADKLLGFWGIVGEPFAVLAPGASYGPAKRWDPENFAKLAVGLHARDGTRSVLVGSREDAGPGAEVARRAGACAIDLIGATDLAALVGLLDRSRLVVSNDSGVMHLAAALRKPTLGIFGSTSPVWSGVAAPWVRSLYAAYPCSPCFRRTCPIGYGCLHAIDVESATTAAEELLRS